jgi:hypothetical protein
VCGLGAAAPGPAGSIRPGVAGGAEPVQLGPGGGQVPFGPLGSLAELGAGFLEDLGAGVECLAQFVAFAGGVGAGLGDRVPCLGGDAVGACLGGPQLPGAPLRLGGVPGAELVQLGGVPGCLIGQLLLRPGQAGR